MTHPAAPAAVSDSSELARAVAERRHATQQRARIQAGQEQHRIDAEVHKTRRALVREMHRRGGTDTIAFCDPDFLTVADRPTIYHAIIDAAVTAGGATTPTCNSTRRTTPPCTS